MGISDADLAAFIDACEKAGPDIEHRATALAIGLELQQRRAAALARIRANTWHRPTDTPSGHFQAVGRAMRFRVYEEGNG